MMDFARRMLGMPYCMHNTNGVNCWGLVAAYYHERGQDVPNYVINRVNAHEIASAFTAAFVSGSHGFEKTDTPQEGDVIVFNSKTRNHCGLFIGGKCLHSTPGSGVILQKIKDVRGFSSHEFWAKA